MKYETDEMKREREEKQKRMSDRINAGRIKKLSKSCWNRIKKAKYREDGTCFVFLCIKRSIEFKKQKRIIRKKVIKIRKKSCVFPFKSLLFLPFCDTILCNQYF